MKKHKITLKPTITLEVEMVIQAETRNQAITNGEAYIIKKICEAFGGKPGNIKISY